MKAAYDAGARKRPVNLTLNEDLVAQARKLTDNLSGVIEALLSDFLKAEMQRRAAEVERVRATIEVWNRFAEQHGSFADDHSTL
jgi:antitoxin CcdA